MLRRRLVLPVSVSAILFCGFLVIRAQEAPVAGPVQPDCPYFGSQREAYADQALRAMGARSQTGRGSLSSLTGQVSRMMASIAGGSRTSPSTQPHPAGSIDSYIFADFQKNNITPAPATTDWEFIRRVTLDLTGRIPTPNRVLAFVADTVPNKRANLVEELLASPQWVDKWTMYFGDLYQNTATRPSTSLRRFPEGRNAFYQWIHDSLAGGKPYDQMATALITGATTDSYTDGASNWIINGFITGGPRQDIMDSMTANVFDTFLGITHVNCLLCHNGRGHLDSLSLWGSQTTRYQAWQLAAYLSHTTMSRGYPDSTNKNVYYWAVQDNRIKTDYALNTTSGNRPARVAPSGCKSGQPCFYVSPEYIFNGDTPKPGENYRAALARDVTGDFQFARATVNYIWAQFFGRGIVDPPDTFDPARLDPNNPPPVAVDPATQQCRTAECARPALRHRRLQPQGADARDRELRYLPALQPLRRRVEPGVGTLLRTEIRSPALV